MPAGVPELDHPAMAGRQLLQETTQDAEVGRESGWKLKQDGSQFRAQSLGTLEKERQ
jgi:hypothetical protein